MSLFGTVSFALCAVAYGVVTVVLLLGRPGSERAGWMVGAAAFTVLWGIVGAWLAFYAAGPRPAAAIFDALHGFVWAAAMLSFLAPSVQGHSSQVRRRLSAAAATAALWVVLSAAFFGAGINIGLILLSVVGLLSVEQVYRNAGEAQRRPFRMLAIAIGVVFVADLFVFSQAVLFGGVVREFWAGRALVAAAVAPLVVLGLKNNPEWVRGLFVSRQAAFYTASLLGVGIYLIAMAVIAYLLRAFGGEWSFWFQLAFLAAAFLMLTVALFSHGLRARLKVYVVKHFYRSKYDYRGEWLRLTDRLARAQDFHSLADAALQGICSIVNGVSGELWLTRDGRRYERNHALGNGLSERVSLEADHAIVHFLSQFGWVIDSDEYERSPDHYDSAFGPPEEGMLPRDSLIVPLDCRGDLLGFAIIARPAALGKLNFDDHDILKTAGKQIAAFFAQALAQEQLAETREFEAMNKLSTFLMHDLKNLIAQQELVVRNAQKFGDRPEFIRDAIGTIRSGVERMKSVVGQLRGGAMQARAVGRTDVSKVLYELRSRCADREPVPEIAAGAGEAVWVLMEREKLMSALTHLVRNAQDATAADGRIEVAVAAADGELRLEVTDTGEGMDHDFIRDHLFRPFDSTKGAEGMGIGVYQVRELVRAAGGDIDVSSRPGQGTTFRIRLPCEPAIAHQVREPV